MMYGVKLAVLILILSTLGSAQDGLIVHAKGKQKWPAADAQKIYRSACAVVQREFGATVSGAPQVTLVLGADKNEVQLTENEIKLIKWDRNAFAQGVVLVAFESLMMDRRVSMAKRALIWADATLDVREPRH